MRRCSVADLIETRRVRAVIDTIKHYANQRRIDATKVPCLGPTYTAMGFAADEAVALLEAMLEGHTLRAPDPQANSHGAGVE